jgi:hypothetical protein
VTQQATLRQKETFIKQQLLMTCQGKLNPQMVTLKKGSEGRVKAVRGLAQRSLLYAKPITNENAIPLSPSFVNPAVPIRKSRAAIKRINGKRKRKHVGLGTFKAD